MKQCSNCKVAQPDDLFYERSGRPGVLHSWCIKCTKELRVKRNPETAQYQKERRALRDSVGKRQEKNYQLKYKFDITLEEYEQMLEAQGHACAVCGRADGSDKHHGSRMKQLSVDHDHQTGAVRGLLCNDCNRAIGQLQDDPELLERAAQYLRSYEGQLEKASVAAESLLDELMKL